MYAFITFIFSTFLVFFSYPSLGQLLSIEKEDRFYRLSIQAKKESLKVERNLGEVVIETSEKDLGKALEREFSLGLQDGRIDQSFIKQLKTEQISNGNLRFLFKVSLFSTDIFHFYRDRKKSYVIDFWKNNPSSPSRESFKSFPTGETPKSVKKKIRFKKNEDPYFSFSHGASFWWNYRPLLPVFTHEINISEDAPDFFHPIKSPLNSQDGDYQKHLQLIVNFYQNRKYSLMQKLITFIKVKYGHESPHNELIDYIKVNASVRGNSKRAIPELESYALKASSGAMKKACLRYLVAYYDKNRNNTKALKFSKIFYSEAKKSNKREELSSAASMIMFYVASLDQIDDLKKLADDKTIVDLIPAQSVLSYRFFSFLHHDQIDSILKEYKLKKKNLVKPVDAGILFNVAEANFRKNQYEQALPLFDEFIQFYSSHPKSGEARNRLALIYDLLSKPPEIVGKLYRRAIDRSSSGPTQYEAAIRYAALRSVRKKDFTKEDLSTRELLNRKESDRFSISRDLQELLWLVRFRGFIRDGNFQDGFSYLKSIPMEILPLKKREVFLADGAQLIGLGIGSLFKEKKYSEVVKLWEENFNRYKDFIILNSRSTYLAGEAFIRLGFFDSFEKYFSQKMGNKAKNFVAWTKSSLTSFDRNYLLDLRIMKNISLGNFEDATNLNEKRLKKSSYYPFFKGIVHYKKNQYRDAVESLEDFILQLRGRKNRRRI